jgi:tetratricopeptide (TPR) repeat protein
VLPLELADAREVFLRIAGTEFASDPLLEQFLDAVGCVPYAVTLLGYLAQTEPNLEGLWNRWCIERTKLLQGPLVGEDYQRMAASFEVSISAPTVSHVSRQLLSILAMLPDGMSVEEVIKVFPDLGEEACCTLRKAALVLPRESRLRLHGLLREHVREKHPPQADYLRRAVDYYADLAIREERLFGARDSHKAVSRFAANLSNIECMIHTALHGAVESKTIEAAASLAAFICLTGAGSRELISTAAGLQTSMSPLARARFLRNCADLETRYADRERAHSLYEEACKLFKSVDNMEGAADCIKKTADLQRHAGKFKKAAEGYDWALDVQADHQNLVGQAGCIAGLADVAMATKSYFEARSHFTEAMRLCREAENHAGMAYCTMRIGYAALAQEEPEEACKHFEEAIPWADEAYDLLIKNSAIQGLGMAKVACSQFDQAEACFRDTLPFFRRADDTFGIAGCLRGLGDVARSRSNYGLAYEHYLDALQVYRRGQHWPDVAEMCRRLASVAPNDHERTTYETEARKADDKAGGVVRLGA